MRWIIIALIMAATPAKAEKDWFGFFDEDLKHPHSCFCTSALDRIIFPHSSPRHCRMTAAAGVYCANLCAKECP
jgi:hypothetical protein